MTQGTMRRFPALRVAALALLVLPLTSAAGPGQVGVNAAVRNQVMEKAARDSGFHPAVVRAPVQIGEAVQSGPNSALQVLLLDRTVFTVGANARMTIDRFVYDPDRRSSDVALSVARGTFRFMSGPTLHNTGHDAIRTPVASIGVRGTIVEGAVGPDVLNILQGQAGAPQFRGDPDKATLVVLLGPGPNNDGRDKTGAVDVLVNGQTISLNSPLQAALIWPGQSPVTFTLSPDGAAKLAGLIIGGPNGPGQGGLVSGPVTSGSGGSQGPGPGPQTGPFNTAPNFPFPLPPPPNSSPSSGPG